jgi:hypothetical protein
VSLAEAPGRNRKPLVAWVFAEPGRARDLSPGEWDLLLQQAQNTGLGGRLADILRSAGILADVPARVRHVLAMAEVHTDKFRRQTLWEAKSMRAILHPLDQPVILMKGGAYIVRGLAAGRGRPLSDIDILVPRERLGAVENAFLTNGWHAIKHDSYDDRYYREWSHELPPLRHMRRGTVLDIHHTILPPTARYTVDGAKLLPAVQDIPGEPGLMTLQPVDMVLHNIVHLFADGAMENGLRDLVDLHSLLGEFRTTPGFWRGLLQRAEELGLGRPLYYALDTVSHVLEFPVPLEVMAEVEPHAPVTMPLLRPVFARCLRPYHVSAEGPAVAAARFAVYVRSHYLRMPFSMLIPHLTRKAVRRWKEGEAAA